MKRLAFDHSHCCLQRWNFVFGSAKLSLTNRTTAFTAATEGVAQIRCEDVIKALTTLPWSEAALQDPAIRQTHPQHTLYYSTGRGCC